MDGAPGGLGGGLNDMVYLGNNVPRSELQRGSWEKRRWFEKPAGENFRPHPGQVSLAALI